MAREQDVVINVRVNTQQAQRQLDQMRRGGSSSNLVGLAALSIALRQPTGSLSLNAANRGEQLFIPNSIASPSTSVGVPKSPIKTQSMIFGVDWGKPVNAANASVAKQKEAVRAASRVITIQEAEAIVASMPTKRPALTQSQFRASRRGGGLNPALAVVDTARLTADLARTKLKGAASKLSGVGKTLGPKLREVLKAPVGPLVAIFGATAIAATAWEAYSESIGTQIREAQRTGDYSKISASGLSDKIASEFGRQIKEAAIGIDKSILSGAAKIWAGFYGVTGNTSAAINAYNTAELISGAFEDRHKRLSALQDVWSQGHQDALEQAGHDARQQSWAQAIRAVQLGFTFGDMLDMDHRIYSEIQGKMKQNYSAEFVKKVPYPKMSDLEGDKD